MLTVLKDLKCPTCGADERHPTEASILIRGAKIFDQGVWWSQCLVCSGGYHSIDNLTFTEANHNPNKGWFY